jgi:hypothetical protein
MSTVAYAQRRGLREAAARERRKKILAFSGVGLLAVVLVIQVPRTLEMMRSDSSGMTSAPAPTTSSPAPLPAGSAPQASRALRSARRHDPFVAQRIGDGETPPAVLGAPAGLRDPFQSGSAPTPTTNPAPVVTREAVPQRIIVGTPGARPRFVGYTVVLASIPTRNGRAQAVRFARSARARGVSGVGVLQSSTRNRLRPGYWVVYSGTFRNTAGAQRAAARVHAQGYRTAYLRQLVRY